MIMDNRYNLNQKAKREVRNEIRTNLRLPRSLILKLKIKAFEQRLRTNTYLIKLLELALDNIIMGNEIKNFYQSDDYDEIQPLQAIIPKDVLTNIKIFAIVLEEKEYYQDTVNGIKTKGRSVIDLIHTGMLLDEKE